MSTAVCTLSRNGGLNRRANATAEYRYPVWKAADANLFPSKFAYSHSGFYKASMVKDCDIFRCVEDGQLYAPAGTACDTTMKGPTLKGGGSMNADGEKHIEGNFHAVSLSGGKDSTAMLLLMIEQDMPIDGC